MLELGKRVRPALHRDARAVARRRRRSRPERLFSFLYYPIPNTDPPKFNTDYDKLSDRDILAIEESILARSRPSSTR